MPKKVKVIFQIVLATAVLALFCVKFWQYAAASNDRIVIQDQYEKAQLVYVFKKNKYTKIKFKRLEDDLLNAKEEETNRVDDLIVSLLATFFICAILLFRNYQDLKDFYRQKTGFKYATLDVLNVKRQSKK